MATKANKKTGAGNPSPSTQPGRISLLRKVTVALVKSMPVGQSCTIAGTAYGYETITTNYGDSCKFSGDFGLKGPDGQVYRATVCYLPKVAEPLLVNALNAAHEAEDDAKTPEGTERIRSRFRGVEFAFRLTKTPDKSERNKSGYQWTAEPLVDIQPEKDKVSLLLQG